MAKIVLYSRASSSCAFRVRIALNILQLDYELVSQSQVDEKYRKVNPQGLIPALQYDDILMNQVRISLSGSSDSSQGLYAVT